MDIINSMLGRNLLYDQPRAMILTIQDISTVIKMFTSIGTNREPHESFPSGAKSLEFSVDKNGKSRVFLTLSRFPT